MAEMAERVKTLRNAQKRSPIHKQATLPHTLQPKSLTPFPSISAAPGISTISPSPTFDNSQQYTATSSL